MPAFYLLLPIFLLLLCQVESAISVANGYFDTLNHLSCHFGCEGVSPCPCPSVFFVCFAMEIWHEWGPRGNSFSSM